MQPAARNHPLPVSTPHSVLPDKYAGDLAGCCNFLWAMECHLSVFPELKEGQRITTLVMRLKGVALQWGVAVWQQGGICAENYYAFVEDL